ncbi:glucose-6-phosphate isomerase [Falsigemmobacter intermedius]|uniref:Glucose-6-phosphate isomerase n=1 Tax=Falsigemmobacter intermedius TaxID=1553448 RepID=A0A3S3YEY6_9RHOB|nr:glucose-6-phosphate isomerase [Falsigemmobacter intermedius]RWY39230.1 glucose-6-phosphate isomerase [Falsigemmobacter intermedius]
MLNDQSWRELSQAALHRKDSSIQALFEAEDRAARFSARLPYTDGGTSSEMLFDFSKTLIDDEVLALLLRMAEDSGLAARREAMFTGARINETEGRAVLHTMLRGTPDPSLPQADIASMQATRARMAALCEAVRSGAYSGPGGRFTDIVNIGIGGSDLGPAMASIALSPFRTGPRTHFLSNVDPAHANWILSEMNPARTLVLIASKTFTTTETMANARIVRNWLQTAVADPAAQMVAISSDAAKAGEWGIPPERVFGFGDYIGGRYSVWGPVGLSLMLTVGPERFNQFLAGAAHMDQHFRTAPMAQNLPVLLALSGVWHAQGCGYPTRAVLPYDQRLARLPAYLQQLEMESNGKRVAMDGSDLPCDSGPVVWGEPGTNGQHAFYQLIHQGTRIIPCEFLVAAKGCYPEQQAQHRLLVANCLAQAKALMTGRSLEEARARMAAAGLTGAELERQARHRVFPGNRPSVMLAYHRLTPFTLGMILALYEHRVFVEGVLLGINSFDQWGVELGKELALTLEPMLSGERPDGGIDGSTQQMVRFMRSEASG